MEEVVVNVRTAPVDCWSCGAETSIVSSIELSRGETSAPCSISDFTAYPRLVEPVRTALRDKVEIGDLKMRHSKTLARSYVSNGCAHCDALFGQHFEIHARYGEIEAARFAASAADGWGALLDALLASDDGHLFHF
ncbi:MAG: hypothetical protein J0I69_04945 [Altererythrobacter sp.]|nr:hypothetical protein [Altererythrobacter sp.]